MSLQASDLMFNRDYCLNMDMTVCLDERNVCDRWS